MKLCTKVKNLIKLWRNGENGTLKLNVRMVKRKDGINIEVQTQQKMTNETAKYMNLGIDWRKWEDLLAS
jgi:hypothetical protein